MACENCPDCDQLYGENPPNPKIYKPDSQWVHLAPCTVTALATEISGGPVTGANTTATLTTSTGAGSTTAGVYSVSLSNIGDANATVAGASIPPGTTVSWKGYLDEQTRVFYRVPSIAYNATGTTLLISQTG